jgi:hypothetical protein
MVEILQKIPSLVISLLSSGEFWGGVLIPTLILVWFIRGRYYTDSIKINLPFGLGSANYNTTPTSRIIAWKLYIQLVTRKAALPFDEEFDVISEVYDSLYDLFKITRDLLSGLSPQEFQHEQGIASLVLRVLNDGIRPHLTKWQAEYRAWLEVNAVLEENRNLKPQEIQRKFPGYEELVSDLKRTNTELRKLADDLKEFSSPKKRKRPRRGKIVPEAPASLQ